MKALRSESVPAIGLHDATVGLGVSGEAGPVTITGVCLDSRMVRPGDFCITLSGFYAYGAGFTTQVVERGAIVVLTDPEGARVVEDVGVLALISHRLRPATAEMSARVYGEPASGLELFGVTGTNGKTITVALLEATLAAIGWCTGTIGTLGFRLDGRTLPSGRSTIATPDSPDLQTLLVLMRERGAYTVATEVSSHAMVMSQVDALKFEVVAFLNLGRDHLDFHRNMEEYFEAKAALFTSGRTRAAVVWIDNEHGRRIADRARRVGLPVVTAGTREEADYCLVGCEPVLSLGGRAQFRAASGKVVVELALSDWHNMMDVAIAVAMLERAGVLAGTALLGLARTQVPGRTWVLPLSKKIPTVIVGSTHTPQAVMVTLDTIQGLGEVITVVGYGEDWDPDKRPLMGRAAAKRSDVSIITDDNPRTEDPARIRVVMLARIGESRAWVVGAGGRGNTIELALVTAGRDSVVAVLGKGHEQGQQIGNRVVAFDDALVVLEA